MNIDNKVLLLGGIILDRYFEVEGYPGRGDDTLITNSFDRVGGCSLNVAVTLNNLGSVPYLVSKLGGDEAGIQIQKYIEGLALPTDCILMEPGKKTGYCLNIIDPTGERTFFTYKGCEIEFSPEMLHEDLLRSISFVYVTGYYLLNKRSTSGVLHLIEQLRQNRCPILFDPGPLLGNIDASQLLRMVRLTDWILPNQSELKKIQAALGFETDPVKWLLDQGCQYVAVKKGEQGADLYSPSSTLSVKGFRVKTVDSTGAGDSFAGGLIHGLLDRLNPDQAVELGNACGAYTASIEGPHSIFTREELDQFIAKYKDNIE